MNKVQVVRGNRERLINYLRRHPEAQELTLVVTESAHCADGLEHTEASLPSEARQLNGVPLFPELPQRTPVTPEIIKQLLDEEITP